MRGDLIKFIRIVIGSEEEDDDFEATGYESAILIFVLITILVIVTMLFEFGKDQLMSSLSKYTRPIALTLFSEMTVLGFISLVAFVSEFGGGLETLSEYLFGDDASEYIVNCISEVQGVLMTVMILTVIQAMTLIWMGSIADAKYNSFNELCQNRSEMQKQIARIDDIPNDDWWQRVKEYCYSPLAAWEKYSDADNLESLLVFYSLRKEHILRRHAMPPFAAEAKDKRLSPDFDYALYQSICMNDLMNQMITLTPLTWIFVWIFMLILFGLLVAVSGDYLIYAIVVLIIDYVDLAIVFLHYHESLTIVEQLINPAHFQVKKKKVVDKSIVEHSVNRVGPDTVLKKRSTGSGSEVSGHTSKSGRSSASSLRKGASEDTRSFVSFGESDHSSISEGNNPDPNSPRKIRRRRKSFKTTMSGEVTSTRLRSLSDCTTDEEKEDESPNADSKSTISASGSSTATSPDSEWNVGDRNHVSMLVRVKSNKSVLPAYACHELTTQSWISRFFLGNALPNRHEALLVGDKMGPIINMMVLRVHTFIQSVNLSIAMWYLIPYVFDNYGVTEGCIYIGLILIPLLILASGIYSRTVIVMTQIETTGQLRDVNIQNEVIRNQKMMKVVRLMLMLTKIAVAESNAEAQGDAPADYSKENADIQEEVAEIERIFDTFDTEGTGEVNVSQLELMMQALGVCLDDMDMDKLFLTVDADHSGTVSKDELVAWRMKDRVGPAEEDFYSLGKRIFDMIDVDGSGDVTLEEFRDALLKFNEPPYNAGLTDAEIVSLLHDFDADGDGEVSLEEFLKVIEMADE